MIVQKGDVNQYLDIYITLAAVEYFCINMDTKWVFSIWNKHKYISQLISLHLNTYIMGYGHYTFLIIPLRRSTLDFQTSDFDV